MDVLVPISQVYNTTQALVFTSHLTWRSEYGVLKTPQVLTAQRPAHEGQAALRHLSRRRLQAGMASLATTRQPSSHKLPAAATPEKCAIEMTSAGFRSWRRSVESWLRLAGWPDREAVLHIRLLCVPKLQCALDARFDSGQWEALTPKEALDAIGKLVLQASNQAVKWCDFF